LDVNAVRTKLLILDFDGTFTDAHEEAKPFVTAFRDDFFDLLGREAPLAWEREEAEVLAHPTKYGWRNGGVITAPAGADPYLTVSCIAQNLCDLFGILKNETTRSEVLQALYKKNYPLTRSAPRADAKRVLENVLARELAVAVVTNSRTDSVTGKIVELKARGGDALRIIGDAKKFVIDATSRDATFDALSDVSLPGLDTRPVKIKRGHYYDVLKELWRETDSDPASTLVCGDIFELDLALPLALGARVHLVYHERTPAYEVTYLREHPRGSVSTDLAGVLDVL
jgi:FMN phosphatase YigB (HAD superfamily)